MKQVNSFCIFDSQGALPMEARTVGTTTTIPADRDPRSTVTQLTDGLDPPPERHNSAEPSWR